MKSISLLAALLALSPETTLASVVSVISQLVYHRPCLCHFSGIGHETSFHEIFGNPESQGYLQIPIVF